MKKIHVTDANTLKDKTVVLAVTGSIAAVRCVELAHSLIRKGARVIPVMSDAATRILHPDAMHYAAGNQVITEITGGVEHVVWCGADGDSDLLLIAPATANTISKIACGIDDTAVTTFATTAIGSRKPVLVAPAMHEAMYNHPAVVDNIRKLERMGVTFVESVFEEGKAKIAQNEDIILETERILGSHSLDGKNILITSGATSERIDPIRIITSRASGRTGVALAVEAYRRGAGMVTIVHSKKQGLHAIREIIVESAKEMTDAVLKEAANTDVLISAAAISDFTVDKAAQTKIDSGSARTMVLKPVVKLLSKVTKQYPYLPVIGFKAETNISTEELITRAGRLMDKYKLAAVVANDVESGGIGEETNRIHIIQKNNGITAVEGRKDKLAKRIIDVIEELV
ncbi:MAG: DNA / pantothenate metabolism flavoprotein [Candidatus Argoarchaeum ethanivorans]|uniref:Coenzyme A biosynthesis bifunctional protein CoaBC n=1 Tax=Candidatus Argoarchaeum ethanivorans TaxID=2608793 RepID=A0A811TCG6_9EURY|nr:MAG: DNA / pantothenate metabolism flavoprotein [Candidatus Argoarchaeum ethanivorans]